MRIGLPRRRARLALEPWRDAAAEDDLAAMGLGATEAAADQADGDGSTLNWDVGNGPAVEAVDTVRGIPQRGQ